MTTNATIETPWSSVGYLTYKRTYSRRKADGTLEEFPDTIARILDSCRDQLDVGFTEDEEQRLADYLASLKGTVAGRFLWQMGTDTVGRLGLASLQNCFSGGTEIITRNGVRSLADLSLSQCQFDVWTGDKWEPATCQSFGVQTLNEITFGLPTNSNHKVVVHATGNHRWELLGGEVTDHLKVGDKVRIPAVSRDGLQDTEAFRHGLVFGDGSQSYRYMNGDYSFCIRLCGAKEKYKDLFDKYHYQPNCNGDPVAYHRSSTNFKSTPADGMPVHYVRSFIEGWLSADGSLTPSGSYVLSTQDRTAAEWLTRNAAFGGWEIRGVSECNNDTNFGPRSAPLIRLTLRRSMGDSYMVVRDIVEIGEDAVYCAVVPGVERFTLANGLLTCNCAFVTVDDPVRPFTWAFDMLMLGSGVGYNIQRESVDKLSPVLEGFKHPVRVDSPDADFIVPDTREGWVHLLHHTLSTAFYNRDSYKPGFTYSTHCVRSKGAPIKGFGGVASGPEDLVRGIQQISSVLWRRRGKQLRPLDCLDIMNIIGSVVVAGNVRRSAQIAIGDCDDVEYLNAKNWAGGNIPNWRAMSNNSVVCNDINKLPEAFWRTYEGGSEPYGLINLELARSCGRLGDTQYPDPDVQGFNPCAEQSLANFETCCLAEVYLSNIASYAELIDVLKLLYRVNKHSLRLPCHHKETEAIVHKNMRMGIGVTGYLQATEEQRSWLKDAYVELRDYDKKYSAERGWPISIKLATVKPSGTLSLLPGVTPGVHPGYAQHMIRRIRIAADNPLVQQCRDHGYPVEYVRGFDGKDDHSTVVVEFPFAYPVGSVLAEHVTAIDQLNWIERLQREWSDNSVSCTVYYKAEELPAIREHLKKKYNNTFKTVSFLLHSDHGFDQAPFEEITKEEYDRRVASSRLITGGEVELEMDMSECAGGACPIR